MGFWRKLWQGVRDTLRKPTPGPSKTPAEEFPQKPYSQQVRETLSTPSPLVSPQESPPEPPKVGDRWSQVERNLRQRADDAGTDVTNSKLQRGKELFAKWAQPAHVNNEERRQAFEEWKELWEDELIYEDTLAELWNQYKESGDSPPAVL